MSDSTMYELQRAVGRVEGKIDDIIFTQNRVSEALTKRADGLDIQHHKLVSTVRKGQGAMAAIIIGAGIIARVFFHGGP